MSAADLATIREELESSGNRAALEALDRIEQNTLTLLDAADGIVPHLDANEVVPEMERAALLNALYLFDRGKR